MISKDNTRRSKLAQNRQNLDLDIAKSAIKGLDMRSALEFYGVKFNHQGAALCPFHNEKTASFRIKRSAAGWFWHCFGCGKTGDLILFVRDMFGLSYPDAVQAICRDFGINALKPRIDDLARLDNARLKQYNSVRRYKELIAELDERTRLYLYAWNTYCHAVLMRECPASRDIWMDDAVVDAQFALLRTRYALEDAEYACVQYLRENPQATPRPPESLFNTALQVRLPPAPKWGTTPMTVLPDSISEKR